MKRLAAIGLFLSLIFPALAQASQFPPVASGNLFDNSVSIGTSAVQMIPANTSRQYLIIQNVSSTATVGCSTTSSPVIGNAGTVTLVSNGSWSFAGNFIPTSAFWCIASAISTPVTVKEGHQ